MLTYFGPIQCFISSGLQAKTNELTPVILARLNSCCVDKTGQVPYGQRIDYRTVSLGVLSRLVD